VPSFGDLHHWEQSPAAEHVRRRAAVVWSNAAHRRHVARPVVAAASPDANMDPMKLEFDEPQRSYNSGSQSARAWTEQWVHSQVYCPSCGSPRIAIFPNNSPVADFYCTACNEEYELKSQKCAFRDKILDGAFRTKCERLAANNNPNLFLLNYDLKLLSVTNFFVVPKHFFVREIIEERKALQPTARRAGWIGSKILLNQIPEAGKIFIVRAGKPEPKETVLAKWQRTLFLRAEKQDARGWLLEVMKCVEGIGKREFQLEDVYAFEGKLSGIYPGNQNIRPKIRQQLQFLRDRGYLDFVSRGYYRLRSGG
jgi:type II restriction enzyme